MKAKPNHFTVLEKYDSRGRRYTLTYTQPGRGAYERGKKVILKKEGYIADGVVWSAWGCQEGGYDCPQCEMDWKALIGQVRSGCFKRWPTRQFKHIPLGLRAEFTRAYLEGKVTNEG